MKKVQCDACGKDLSWPLNPRLTVAVWHKGDTKEYFEWDLCDKHVDEALRRLQGVKEDFAERKRGWMGLRR